MRVSVIRHRKHRDRLEARNYPDKQLPSPLEPSLVTGCRYCADTSQTFAARRIYETFGEARKNREYLGIGRARARVFGYTPDASTLKKSTPGLVFRYHISLLLFLFFFFVFSLSKNAWQSIVRFRGCAMFRKNVFQGYDARARCFFTRATLELDTIRRYEYIFMISFFIHSSRKKGSFKKILFLRSFLLVTYRVIRDRARLR